MKKTLVAMAVMAVAGAASAQATLYGKIDIGWEYLDAAGVQTNKVGTGQFSGSRWGVKGTEDLGGGLGVVYQLEGGFQPDTGLTGQSNLVGTGPNSGVRATTGVLDTRLTDARIFGRQAYVGFTGGFGSLTLGRQYTPNDNILGLVDPMGAAGAQAGPMYSVFTSQGANVDNKGAGRQNNAISYSTPNMSGLGVQVMFAPDETGVVDQRFVGVNATYSAGPISAGVSYEQQTITGAAKSDTGVMIGGMYDLGAVRLGGTYFNGTKSNATEDKISAFYAGLSVPLGAATLSAGYARQTLSVAGSTDATSTGFGANAVYTLSKQTNLYAGYLSKDDVSALNVSTKTNSFVAGMRKDF